MPLQVKGKGLLTRVIFALAFRWKQLRIKMGAAVESVSACFRAPLSTLVSAIVWPYDVAKSASRLLLLLAPIRLTTVLCV